MAEKVQPYRPLELMRDPKITDFSCDDFIGVWENFVPESFCDQCIKWFDHVVDKGSSRFTCLLYTSPSPRDGLLSRMPSSA